MPNQGKFDQSSKCRFRWELSRLTAIAPLPQRVKKFARISQSIPGKSCQELLAVLNAQPVVGRIVQPGEMVAENGGTSLLLPPVPVYAGVELSRKAG